MIRCLAASLAMIGLAHGPATADTITFDFEDLPATESPFVGNRTSLTRTKGGVSMEITRPPLDRFGIVENSGPQSKPLEYGSRTVTPFVNSNSDTRLFARFSQPVSSVSIDMGDYGEDRADALELEAFDGQTRNSLRLGKDFDVLPTLKGDIFNSRNLSVNASGIQSVEMRGGTPSFPNSVFYDNLTIKTDPQAPQGYTFHAPFYASDPREVTQVPGDAPGETYSHEGILRNAIDLSQIPSDDNRVPIAASQGGRVHVQRDHPAFGNFVTINHGPNPNNPEDDIFSLYAHLDQVDVHTGQLVNVGDKIGIEGDEGIATGKHVHWDVYSGDSFKDIKVSEQTNFANFTWNPVGLNDPVAGMRLTTEPDAEASIFDHDDLFSLEGETVYSDLKRPNTAFSSGTIRQGEIFQESVFINDGDRLEALLRWPGSEMALNVIAPSGESVFKTIEGDGVIEYVNESPASGFWGLRVTGVTLPDGGDRYSFAALTSQQTATVPLPATIWLLAVGLIGLLGFKRFRFCVG